MFPTLATVMDALVPVLMGLVLTWFWRYRDTEKKRVDVVADERKLWRQGRIDAEISHKEALRQERQDRVEWQLKREAEIASITGILEDSTTAHRLLASIAATSTAHGGQLIEFNERLNLMQGHINNLSMSISNHGKPS